MSATLLADYKKDTQMNELTLTDLNGTLTVTSLQVVDFINANRKEGESELRHDNFMVKTPKVLGESLAPKLLGTAFYEVNGAKRERPIYHLGKREACLMAMSYSYELQAKVFDAWVAAEERLRGMAAPVDYPTALRALADKHERLALAQAETKRLEHKVEALDEEVVKAIPAQIAYKQIAKSESCFTLRELWQNLERDCREVGITGEKYLREFLCGKGLVHDRLSTQNGKHKPRQILLWHNGHYQPREMYYNVGRNPWCTLVDRFLPDRQYGVRYVFTPHGFEQVKKYLGEAKVRLVGVPNDIMDLFGAPLVIPPCSTDDDESLV